MLEGLEMPVKSEPRIERTSESQFALKNFQSTSTWKYFQSTSIFLQLQGTLYIIIIMISFVLRHELLMSFGN